MRNYDDLREMLCNELDELYNDAMRKGGANAADLDAIRDITSAIKNTYKIECYEDDQYSHSRDWGTGDRMNYGHGSSYARRGMHYVRGHYSRTDATEHMRKTLDDLMRDASSDETRDVIRRCMDALER